MRRSSPLLLVLAVPACVWTGPPEEPTDNGFAEGARPSVPLCLASEPELQTATDAAVSQWTDAVGAELFDCMEAGGYPVSVTLVIAGGDTPGSAERTTAGDGTIVGCAIRIAPGWANATVVAHELGHCLGLEHDEATGYLMDSSPAIGAEISPADAERIRALL